jgi:hypothetical protein
MIQWVNFINNAYINFAAQSIKVFKLDKVQTPNDKVYMEEQFSRIYLHPFTIRAFHLDNTWKQMLGGILPYREEEDNIKFTLNFENMVQTIRGLRYSHTSEIIVSYTGAGNPTAQKSNGTLNFYVNGTIVGTYSVSNSNYNTTIKLANAIASLPNFSVTLNGNSDLSANLVDFANVSFKNQSIMIFSWNPEYKNLTDVIEYGDAILTNKWRLYEVVNANPSGDMGWDWVQYTLTCNLLPLDRAILPGDYGQQIKAHQFNLPRTNLEGYQRT